MASSSKGSGQVKFHPNKSFKFPKRKFGKNERSFRAEWCEKFDWLHYDVDSDSAFCHLCKSAEAQNKLLASTKKDPAFISRGFTYWKEATTAFQKHQCSQCHQESIEALIHLPQQIQGDIGELLNHEHQAEKANNRKIFLLVLHSIRYPARRGLPLRGHCGDVNSNFMQLLHFQSISFPELKSWIAKKTDKYTSPVIQNECMQIMALNIIRDIANKICEGLCFSVMADKCTDISNKEQFTICFRWVDSNLQDHEDFIGLYEVDNIGADCLVHHIKDVLLRMNLSLSKCRGQCYDGASNMRGVKNGVAAQLSSVEKRAIYTHCYGHSLNLAVSDCIKKCKVCSDALDLAFEITKLIKFSPKRESALSHIREDSGPGIRKFCPTRWTVKGNSVQSILGNYNNLKQLWDECLEQRLDPDVKGRIIGVKSQMSQYKVLFGLKLCERILKITDNLNTTLQKQELSAAEAQSIARMTIKTLQSMRSDEAFKLFFDLVEHVRENTATDKPTLPRKRKAPSRFEIGHGEGYHAPNVEDHYRSIYFQALDYAVSSIEDRFDQPGFQVYKNLEELLVRAANKQDYSTELKDVLQLYGDDFDEDELTTQLQIFSTNFDTDIHPVTLQGSIKYLQNLTSGQRVFLRQVCTVASLILVMPATNTASERSFSTLRRVKSYLRCTMKQARLNHAMVLHTYTEMLDNLDLNSIANEFVKGSEHRLTMFGKFV